MFTEKKHKLTKTQMLAAFEDMLLIRRFEERCGQLYGMGQIGGFCHLYIGQEAVVVATKLAKIHGDSTITSYRDHGHTILFGVEPKHALAELLGKVAGCSKGKGGSMHMFSTSGKFYGGHGIVGAQVPIGTGIAFAEKYRGTQNICYTFLGDGAANQGQIFEAFNMAALWDLPVLYIIENNEYAMGTSVSRSTAVTDLYKRGESLGISGVQADGMYLENFYNILKQATDWVRENSKPFIIEAKTYRYRGHSMSDPAKYRAKEEVEQYRSLDPLEHCRTIIIESGFASEEELKLIENKIKDIVMDAVQFAQNAPLPADSELYTDIFKE